jgi:hypothetical protein
MNSSPQKAVTVLAFLWRAHAQSGFKVSTGECIAIKDLGAAIVVSSDLLSARSSFAWASFSLPSARPPFSFLRL